MAQNLQNHLNNNNNNNQIQNPNSNSNNQENIEEFDGSFLNPSNPFCDFENDENSDTEQMNFVTDLFSPNEQYPCFNFATFGVESEFHENIGMRVIGIESDSDSEGFIRNVDDDPFGDTSVPIFWNDRENRVGVNLDLEWEEVGDQRILERDGLGSIIERIEELSVSSEISNFEREEMGDGVEEGDRDLEWEFLLAVNNLGRNLELEDESFGEYDELFGQLMQNGGTSKGSPPTAKSFVENLPIVVMSEEELKKDIVVCAVCKDDISVEGSVTRLPCSHLYHEDCIVPWLCIRNTCPVCRHELPTDDADYERRKSHEEGVGMSQDLLIRYAFEPIF